MSGDQRKMKGQASEVEELLRAAEDEMLLNIAVGSHSARSDPLDSGLARRFQALKTPSSSSPSSQALPPPPPQISDSRRPTSSAGDPDDPLAKVLGVDLSARFAALKASSRAAPPPSDLRGDPRNSDENAGVSDDAGDDSDVDEDGVSKKEVDKLMQWAMDAARLDPSISTDDDDFDGDDDDDFEETKEAKKIGENKKKRG